MSSVYIRPYYILEGETPMRYAGTVLDNCSLISIVNQLLLAIQGHTLWPASMVGYGPRDCIFYYVMVKLKVYFASQLCIRTSAVLGHVELCGSTKHEMHGELELWYS